MNIMWQIHKWNTTGQQKGATYTSNNMSES